MAKAALHQKCQGRKPDKEIRPGTRIHSRQQFKEKVHKKCRASQNKGLKPAWCFVFFKRSHFDLSHCEKDKLAKILFSIPPLHKGCLETITLGVHLQAMFVELCRILD